jgi:hypothetical protein
LEITTIWTGFQVESVYAQVSDNTTQIITGYTGLINPSNSVSFNTTSKISGISLVGSNSLRLPLTGTYHAGYRVTGNSTTNPLAIALVRNIATSTSTIPSSGVINFASSS